MSQVKTDPVLAARARLGVAMRSARGGGSGDPAQVAQARRDLAAAKLERAIRETLAGEPPLLPADRERLAALLSTGGLK